MVANSLKAETFPDGPDGLEDGQSIDGEPAPEPTLTGRRKQGVPPICAYSICLLTRFGLSETSNLPHSPRAGKTAWGPGQS